MGGRQESREEKTVYVRFLSQTPPPSSSSFFTLLPHLPLPPLPKSATHLKYSGLWLAYSDYSSSLATSWAKKTYCTLGGRSYRICLVTYNEADTHYRVTLCLSRCLYMLPPCLLSLCGGNFRRGGGGVLSVRDGFSFRNSWSGDLDRPCIFRFSSRLTYFLGGQRRLWQGRRC